MNPNQTAYISVTTSNCKLDKGTKSPINTVHGLVVFFFVHGKTVQMC